MGQLNDQVLTAIALQYGDNQAMESPDLVPAVLPVVTADDYRVRLLNARADFVPPGAVPGQIQFVIVCPVTESWRVVNAGCSNAGAAALILTSFVRPEGGGTKIFQPAIKRVNAGAIRLPWCGDGESINNVTIQEFVPSWIDIPSGAELAVQLTDSVGNFDNAARGIDLQILRLPPTVDWSVAEFKSVLGPV